jgi:hypothetical protein
VLTPPPILHPVRRPALKDVWIVYDSGCRRPALKDVWIVYDSGCRRPALKDMWIVYDSGCRGSAIECGFQIVEDDSRSVTQEILCVF